MELNVALKEWDLLCRAMLAGQQCMLLRKGGIYEAAGEFELEHSEFLLFPTFLHQDPASIKPQWRDKIEKRETEPAVVRLNGWGRVRDVLIVPDRARLDRLDDLHLWDKPLIDMRFNYRPGYPLYLVVVEAWKLPAEVEMPNTALYAGCKSWVPLDRSVPLDGSMRAMTEGKLEVVLHRVRRELA